MSEPASISQGIASRYATAVFELVKESGEISKLEDDLSTLSGALADSEQFRELIDSPILGREEQEHAVKLIAEKAGLSDTMTKTLRLMAQKRRLFVLPALIDQLQARIDEEKGVVEADVTSAHPLSDSQREKLAATLKDSVGKDIKLNTAVDEKLIGGLVVKVGSRMIDTSIRSKLAALQNTMKEVG